MKHQPPEIGIRPMREADLQRVTEIDALSFSLPWPESSFRYDLIRNRHARLWVAETTGSDPKIVATLVVWIILDEAHIGTIAVDPAYRGGGIGTSMLEMLMEYLKPTEVERVFLEVRKSNTVAQSLYHKFGFQPIRVRPRYYTDNGEDAIEMELVIR